MELVARERKDRPEASNSAACDDSALNLGTSTRKFKNFIPSHNIFHQMIAKISIKSGDRLKGQRQFQSRAAGKRYVPRLWGRAWLAQARRDPADSREAPAVVARHADHPLHDVKLLGCLAQTRETSRVMIRATQQGRRFLQQHAQEAVQFAQLIGRHAIMHAMLPWTGDVRQGRTPRNEIASRDERGVGAG